MHQKTSSVRKEYWDFIVVLSTQKSRLPTRQKHFSVHGDHA